jgi:hypothetical protein
MAFIFLVDFDYATAAAKLVNKSPGSGQSNFQVIAIGISDSCRA